MSDTIADTISRLNKRGICILSWKSTYGCGCPECHKRIMELGKRLIQEPEDKQPIMKTFEDFLKNKHMELYPTILDDDLPDAFDNWLEGRTKEEIIEYAEEVLKEILQLVIEDVPHYAQGRILKALKN